MKATVSIKKSYDNGKQFSKEWSNGDFFEFFKDEGNYLDKLCNIMKDEAATGEEFTVTYTVKVAM